MKTNIKKHKAFTLIELLIVIAIIGILSSVILVRLVGGKEKANQAKVLSMAQSIKKIADICVMGGGTLQAPVTGENPGTPICNGGAELLPNLTGTGFKYVGTAWSSVSNSNYAFSINSPVSGSWKKVIICGLNQNCSSWFGGGAPEWDIRGISACVLREF